MKPLVSYFAGSIRGGREDVQLYAGLITVMQQYSEVLTEHVGDKTLSVLGEDGPDDAFIYKRDMGWLRQANALVAEVTIASLGVGFEIGWAAAWEKDILCLYRPSPGKRLSAMVGGLPYDYPKAQVCYYHDLDEAAAIIQGFFARLHH